MADFGPLGGVKVLGFISPFDTNDTYAVIDTIYGIDGLRNVADIAEMNAITDERRRAGMVVGVSGGTTYYRLLSGPWNHTLSDWQEVFFKDTYVTGGTVTSGDTLIHYLNDGSEVSVSLSSITSTIPDITYTNATPTPVTIGGIDAGSTFSAQTMQEMFDQLLYPYQEPAFSSFSRTNLNSQYELGETISIGNQTFNWSTTNSSNVLPNTIKIDQLTPSLTNLLSGSTNDGNELINLTTTIVSTSPATLSLYRITATNTENNTFTSTISRSWRARWYYGRNVNTSITASDITGGTFTTTLATGVVNSYVTFTPGSGYLYLVVPSSFAQPTDFRDSVAGCFGNNVPMIQLSDVSFNNAFGVSQTYKIYRTVNQILGTQNIWMCS